MPNVTGGNRDKFGGSAQSGGNTSGTRGGGDTRSERRSDQNELSMGGKTFTVDVGPNGKVTTTPTGFSTPANRTERGQPGGGTATTSIYEPGSVPNFPDADMATVVDQAVTGLVPGGIVNGLAGIPGAFKDPNKPAVGALGQLLGADPGQQDGFQRDRGRGASSFNPNDARGNAADERAIPGQSFGAGTLALTGDSEDPLGAGTESLFSDVTLRDRRKPRPVVGAGTQMVLG